MFLNDMSDEVRAAMLAEVNDDDLAGRLITSTRLSARGVADYPDLLRRAVQEHDERWLAEQLNMGGRLNQTETRRTRKGIHTVKVPYTAAQTLAEGELNRFFIRGLCVMVLAVDENSQLEVYRAKHVEQPRIESQRLIGKKVSAAKLLDDLRHNVGIDTALGIPAGPNSGLSVRIAAAI